MDKNRSGRKLTFAFCTFNRAERLPNLVASMRMQTCSIPFEILAIDNNSDDDTHSVLERISKLPGPKLRYAHEPNQGIVAARNRAIAESLDSDILVFIDDDELPQPGLLQAAVDAIINEGAECVGGRIDIDFRTLARPNWLSDELLGFLGALDHGNSAFWIEDASTPIWAGNIAYDMNLFRNTPELRFDKRFDRKGKTIGGGEDLIMFNQLLKSKHKIRYRPDMVILHAIEAWRLKKEYFIKIHYLAGYRGALNDFPEYNRAIFGVPPFLIVQSIKQTHKWLMQLLKTGSGLRQAMNISYTAGQIIGCLFIWKMNKSRATTIQSD
ncbi:glycosyltransferase [Methylomonas koyamae]|uniref:Glycosyltransferase n=1 Tax=Methylomonas koyamae TaxID=702114 RepID=A0AA91D9C2_9GAMM|nr:glycosyltransferase [Methylomonas koyamae]OAI22157.1 glycosyltransferase [Methylomonas koyamae]